MTELINGIEMPAEVGDYNITSTQCWQHECSLKNIVSHT